MKRLFEKNEKKLLFIICGLLSVFLAITVWQLSSIKQQYKEFIELIITPQEESFIEIPTDFPKPEKGFRIFGPYDSLSLNFFSKDRWGFIYQVE